MSLKSLISTFLIAAMLMTSLSFAEGEYKSPVKFTKENVQNLENFENRIMSTTDNNTTEYYYNPSTRGTDPGVGSVRVTEIGKWTTGYTYEDMSKTNNALQNLFNIAFTIVGYSFKTGLSIAKDVAQLTFGLNWSEVAASSPGTIRSSHSYSYQSKLGQIYYSGKWNTKVDIEKRYIYGHGYASFKCSDGQTRTGTYDYTSAPIITEKKANYDNTTWITNKALFVYQNNAYPFINAWTHTTVVY